MIEIKMFCDQCGKSDHSKNTKLNWWNLTNLNNEDLHFCSGKCLKEYSDEIDDE